jgi:hypothetical protein
VRASVRLKHTLRAMIPALPGRPSPRVEKSAAQACPERIRQFGRTQLVCACGEPYVAGFNFGKSLRLLDFTMQKHSAKIRFDEVDCHASDGYHIFIALISIVAVTTLAILLGFGIEMFA